MKALHLMVTSLCNRNCPHCCNKQMELPPQVSDDDIIQCDTLCITGGEPFLFSNPTEIARYYKKNYPNIKKVYAYTNAYELMLWINAKPNWQYSLRSIDGLNISIKNELDFISFAKIVLTLSCSVAFREKAIQSNRLYLMINKKSEIEELLKLQIISFEIIDRKWQKDFVPADNSIFRRA